MEDSAEEVFYNSFVAPILEEFASMGKSKLALYRYTYYFIKMC